MTGKRESRLNDLLVSDRKRLVIAVNWKYAILHDNWSLVAGWNKTVSSDLLNNAS